MCASVTGAYLQPLNCHLFLPNSFLLCSLLLSHSHLHTGRSIENTPDIMSAQYGHTLASVCKSMVGSEIWDKYHELLPRAILPLPLRTLVYSWYLSQSSRPTMLSQINTIQPRSSLASGTRTSLVPSPPQKKGGLGTLVYVGLVLLECIMTASLHNFL